jgi:hypothetical protein
MQRLICITVKGRYLIHAPNGHLDLRRTACERYSLFYSEQERLCTDTACTIIYTIFVLVLFVVACFTINLHNLYQINYPTDADGLTCGYQLK